MSQSKKLWMGVFTALIVLSMLLASCQPQEPTVIRETVEVEKDVLVTQVVEVEKTVETEKIVEVTPVPDESAMRDLEGTLRVAAQGALALPGAPENGWQRFWRQVLTLYKVYQPNVTVEIEDVAPGGGPGEQWCEAKKTVADMPDITYVGECNYFRPSAEQVAQGLNIATDFKPYEEEISPYTGKPWKEDWYSDFVRLGRCTEGGAYDMWTCQTTSFGGTGIWVNWDILKQFGYDHVWPSTYTELYELADEINASGTYVAWDSPPWVDGWFARDIWSNLTMDVYVNVLGGSIEPMSGLQASNVEFLTGINQLPHWCDGSMWASNNPSMQEALLQQKRFFDSHFGGGAAFFDPARSTGAEQWLAGTAAMTFNGSWHYGAILQAMQDGVFGVEDWGVENFPRLIKEDLFNKDLEIYFEGDHYQIGGGSGDIFAPTPNVRASGEDPMVDLMVRDFFQFMSSAQVAEIYARETGNVVLNPDVFQNLDPKLKGWLEVRDPMWDGITQPPGSYANQIVYTNDPEFNIRAWWSGQMGFEEAMAAADRNATIDQARKAEVSWPEQGLELPEVCNQWVE